MTEAMDRCPYDKKGQHDLAVIIPENDAHPLVLVCTHCGMTARHSIALPTPMDDLSAADIARLAKQD